MSPLNASVLSRPASPSRRPPTHEGNWIGWIRENFFKGWVNTAVTLLILWALVATMPSLVDWALVKAVWIADDADACRAAAGACWAIITEKHRVMLFGTFPYDQQWRGVAVLVIILGLFLLSASGKLSVRSTLAAWALGVAAVLVLMLGGVLGLQTIATHQWSGIPLTLILFVGTIVAGIPLGVLLALGRRSQMPVIKALCVGFIEIVRGLPLVTVLFMASLMLPLFLPEGFNFDKFLRAQIAMTLFFSAYAAEIVRGGLQSIDRGQYEAADVVGLSYRQKMMNVILPQVARVVLPSMVNEIIRAFKNTTFIGIIGLFDVLRATSTAIQDPVWVQYSVEAYLFIFLLYFICCFAMSKYSQRLELKLTPGRSS